MAEVSENVDNPTRIDQRILGAIERNQEYLGMSDWLGRYAERQNKAPSPRGA